MGSLKSLTRVPLSDALVMIVTVVTVVATDNLSIGVLFGVLLSALTFAWKIASIRLTVQEAASSKTYAVTGQLFFGTTSHFIHEFAYDSDPDHIIIDFSHSHVWDQSAVHAIAKTMSKYAVRGKKSPLPDLMIRAHSWFSGWDYPYEKDCAICAIFFIADINCKRRRAGFYFWCKLI